jgi:hypothetical protein
MLHQPDLLSSCQVPGQCGPGSFAPAALRFSSPEPMDRIGGVGVLSGTRAEFYVLGGRDGAGALRGDAWAFDLRARTWRELPTTGAPSAVLAATYDATRAQLLILDERARRVGARTVREARILALPVDGLSAPRVLATFVRSTWNDRFSLAVDVAGDLWVAAGLRVGRVHVLLQLERDGDRLRPGGFHIGAGRLAPGDALRVDPLGATLLIEDARLGVTPLGVLHRELVRGSGGTDRCF